MKRRKNKSPFRGPLRYRLEYFFVSRRWLKRSVGLALFLLACLIFVWITGQFPSAAPLFQDPGFVGLFGALFGALLGAVIGGYISLYAQLQRFQAEASITKKKEIYEPLYDDLVSFREQIEKHPYSTYFCLDPDESKGMYTPRFGEWTEIKKGSRFIQVPKWIADALDQYLQDIETYVHIRREAVDDTQTKIGEIFGRSLNIVLRRIPGGDEIMLKDILVEDFADFKHNLSTEPNVTISDEEVRSLWPVIQEECNKLESVKRVTSLYKESIVEHTDWLIRELARIIRYINIKYEIQGDLL